MKILMLTVLAVTFAALSYAQGPGHQRTHIKDHPRVNQVNKRIDNQEHRINTKRKEGDLTKAQAQKDRKNLKTVNQEKHDMRKEDNGHLTKADQKSLNQQLNHNSKKIAHQ